MIQNCNSNSSTKYPMTESSLQKNYTHVLCCPSCSFLTLSLASLHQHAIGQHYRQLSCYRTYTCSQCLSLSTERGLMTEHVFLYHRNNKRTVEIVEEVHTIFRGAESHLRSSHRRPRATSITLTNNGLRQRFLKRRFRVRLARAAAVVKHEETETEELSPVPLNDEEPIDMRLKTGAASVSETISGSAAPISSPSGLTQSRLLSYPPLPPGCPWPMYGPPPLAPSHGGPHPSVAAAAVMRYLNHHLAPPPPPRPPQQAQTYKSGPQASMETAPNGRNLHRNNFSPFQNHVLLDWFDRHKYKPYPSTEETKQLAVLCGLSYPQVKKWFANKRARSIFYQKDEMMLRCSPGSDMGQPPHSGSSSSGGGGGQGGLGVPPPAAGSSSQSSFMAEVMRFVASGNSGSSERGPPPSFFHSGFSQTQR